MSSSSSKSSGSEGPATVDEKKRKRMESNRESARRSRQRKQRHLDDLVRQVAQLQNQNGEFSCKMTEMSRRFGAVEAANAVLKAEKDRLARRLESLESVLEIARVVEGSNHGVSAAGSFLESSNGGSSCDQFGGSGFSDASNSWLQTMTMMPADPAASFSMAVLAASSCGGMMFQY